MHDLLRQSPRLLFFCLLTATFSGPGQTYLLSMFVPAIRESLNLSRSAMAVVFALANIAAAGAFPIIGRLLDRLPVFNFSILSTAALALGLLILSFSKNWVLVLVSFTVLRVAGAGAFAMCASTTTSRFYPLARGRALSLMGLGHTLGEALLPAAVTTFILGLGWRDAAFALCLITLFIYAPSAAAILWKEPLSRKPPPTDVREGSGLEFSSEKQRMWIQSQLLKDRRFYLLLYPSILPSFLCTAFFYYQGTISNIKEWPDEAIPLAFTAYAIMRAISSFIIGPMIDQGSARKTFGYNLIPLALSVLVLYSSSHAINALWYLALVGLGVGISGIMGSVLWAEAYGISHLGSLNGTIGVFSVLATAVGPLFMGGLLDLGVSLNVILFITFWMIISGIVSARMGCRMIQPHAQFLQKTGSD